jgi:hypothetical protein
MLTLGFFFYKNNSRHCGREELSGYANLKQLVHFSWSIAFKPIRDEGV